MLPVKYLKDVSWLVSKIQVLAKIEILIIFIYLERNKN